MSSSAYSVSLLRFKLYRFLPDIEPLYMSEKGQMVKQRKRTRQKCRTPFVATHARAQFQEYPESKRLVSKKKLPHGLE